MTRHLIRLVWNRKRHNFLLGVEIFFSFLVLFGVVLLATNFANNWRQPLGFGIERVWTIAVNRREPDADPAVKARHRETFRQLFATLADLPEVEIAAGVNIPPYSNSSWGSGEDLQDGRKLRFGVDSATDQFRDAVNLQVVAGRWFSRDDDGAAWKPVVINRRMALEIFGDRTAVGQVIPTKQEPNRSGEVPPVLRVVGVIEDFRKDGELSTPQNFLFHRLTIETAATGFGPAAQLPNFLIIRVTPATTPAFEETLVNRLQAVARTWSFEVQPLVNAREDMLTKYSLPLLAVGTVAAFLLLMVALGLTGVVWHSVTQRTREFGLRRAKGATIPNVRHQVLAELAIMTSLALLVGVVLVLQLPLLPMKDEDLVVPGPVFLASVALSASAIYLLTLACAWYPSRLATKIQPAEALHYE